MSGKARHEGQEGGKAKEKQSEARGVREARGTRNGEEENIKNAHNKHLKCT